MTIISDKQRVFELGLHLEASKLSRDLFRELKRDPSKNNLLLRLVNYKINQRIKEYGKLWEVAIALNNARFKRIQRLKKRVEPVVYTQQAKFLTITFTDDVLESTNKETRRVYVRRYLKSNFNNYVANIDYGTKKGREHYHAIIECERVDFKTWTYGRLNARPIRASDVDVVRTSKYVAKLSNHAYKTSTKQSKLIYSR